MGDLREKEMKMIPKVIHFIYPVTERTRPWSPVNHASVRLARKYHPDYKIIIWTNKNPEVHYDLLETAYGVGAIVQSIDMPTELGGVMIEYPQYMSDVLRLQLLYAYGGVYMDTDILLRMNLNDLREKAEEHNLLVLSWETPKRDSICNALMISPSENPFIGAWLDAMPEALKSPTWAQGGVKLPVELSERDSLVDSRVILGHRFACPLDLSRPWLFNPELCSQANELIGMSHAIHVFETYWRDTIKHIGRDWLARTPCLFAEIFQESEK